MCYGLAARLKAKDVVLDLVHEVARRCPLPINEDTSVAAQSWILHTQVAEELVAANRHPVVICDRSVLDNYVYLLVGSGRQPALESLVDHWIETYDVMVHVPVVTPPSADGTRATDPAFQRAVDERLRRELSRREIDVMTVEGFDRDRWLDAVEARIWGMLAVPQLPLL